ncbi:Sybindin-like protein, partial [Aureobasidium melanogenum]
MASAYFHGQHLLTKLEPNNCTPNKQTGKMSKALKEAYDHDLDYFKNMLDDHDFAITHNVPEQDKAAAVYGQDTINNVSPFSLPIKYTSSTGLVIDSNVSGYIQNHVRIPVGTQRTMQLFSLNNVVCRYDSISGLRRKFINAFRDEAYLIHPQNKRVCFPGNDEAAFLDSVYDQLDILYNIGPGRDRNDLPSSSVVDPTPPPRPAFHPVSSSEGGNVSGFFKKPPNKRTKPAAVAPDPIQISSLHSSPLSDEEYKAAVRQCMLVEADMGALVDDPRFDNVMAIINAEQQPKEKQQSQDNHDTPVNDFDILYVMLNPNSIISASIMERQQFINAVRELDGIVHYAGRLWHTPVPQHAIPPPSIPLRTIAFPPQFPNRVKVLDHLPGIRLSQVSYWTGLWPPLQQHRVTLFPHIRDEAKFIQTHGGIFTEIELANIRVSPLPSSHNASNNASYKHLTQMNAVAEESFQKDEAQQSVIEDLLPDVETQYEEVPSWIFDQFDTVEPQKEIQIDEQDIADIQAEQDLENTQAEQEQAVAESPYGSEIDISSSKVQDPPPPPAAAAAPVFHGLPQFLDSFKGLNVPMFVGFSPGVQNKRRLMVVFALLVINKAGGLIYNRTFAPGLQQLNSNDYLILAGTFHGIHAISRSLSPVAPPSAPPGNRANQATGIQSLESSHFRLTCFQTPTGTKFLLFTSPEQPNTDQIARRCYDIYADFVMANPFYSLEMPIRVDKFDRALAAYLIRP